MHEKKHETSRRKDEDSQYPLLDYDTQKDEMEIGNEDCFSAERQDGQKEEEKCNPGLSSGFKASRAVGRPRKRYEDDINQFFKPEETEETKGNELKNNDTWIRVAKDQIRWKEMEE